MGVFEFDTVYSVFEPDSIIALFSSAFPEAEPSCSGMLSAAVSLLSRNQSSGVDVDTVQEKAAVSDAEMSAAIRFWIKKGILRKTAYKSPKYKFSDPVPLDPEMKILHYNPFAQAVSNQFMPYRKANPYEIQRACSWKNYPGVPEIVILEVLHQALDMDPDAGVKTAETLLPFVKNARTQQEVISLLADYKTNYTEAKELLHILGQHREPSDRELEIFLKWKNEWKFTFDAIHSACEATNAGSPTFDYLNGILRNIHDASHADSGMNAAAVEESFRLTREVRELKKYIGGFSVTKQRVNEYKALRENYDISLIQLAAKACGVERKSFDDIGKLLLRWEKAGITSVDTAAAYLRERSIQMDLLRDVFDQWGISRSPGNQDLRFVRQWIEMGFSREMILKAAEYAFAADDPLRYTTKVLSKFREKGITTPTQANTDNEKHLSDLREKAHIERRKKELEALKALGANGPYAGQREPGGKESMDEAARRWMRELLQAGDNETSS